ncbi:MAG: M28 family metallopeptidase [Phenylobacterium sp.]
MRAAWAIAAAVALGAALAAPGSTGAPKAAVCADCVRATMQTLAGDALHGRKCGSADENAAARYLADTLARQKIEGALPGGAFLQPVTLTTPTYAAPPAIAFTAPDGRVLKLTHGQEAVVADTPPELDGEVVRIADPAAPFDAIKGKVVVLEGLAGARAVQAARAGAAAVVVSASDYLLQRWAETAQRPPGPVQVADIPPRAPQVPIVFVRPEAFAQLAGFEGGRMRISAPRGEPLVRTTYNVLGVRHGTAPDADRQAILLTAHYDHLGVRNGVTFHGADDDASGTAAVVEFARILGRAKPHRRTVYFGLFGCEEEGALGAKYYLAHPPIEVSDLVANLEFEMIGVDDPQRPGFLMLTGWDRTDLGPTLQAHGAQIGPDLYPAQNFFQRSDNFQLALKGVVAQTISAWPVTPTYHAATDDLAHVDLELMDRTIGSLVDPVNWLLDSDYRPAWYPGKRP